MKTVWPFNPPRHFAGWGCLLTFDALHSVPGMKINHARVWRQDLELSRPYTIAYQHIDRVENLFLQLVLEDGSIGLGAASPAAAVTGETLDACSAALDGLADGLKGEDIRSFQAILSEAKNVSSAQPAACAALDMALHDAFCQWMDIPLVEFLGRAKQALPTSVTLGIGQLEETLREARAFLDQGFRAIKLKTGLDPDADVATCKALRALLGPHVTLRVDANQGYDPGQLSAFAQDTRDLDIELIEQPLPARDIDNMRALPDTLRRRCAADESLHTPEDALALCAEPKPFGIFNIKLMKCGGIRSAREIAGMAACAGIDLMWGCNDESAISITAALHAALASPATRYLDLDGSFDLARDVAEGGFLLRDGMLHTGPGAGLGMRLHRDAAIS